MKIDGSEVYKCISTNFIHCFRATRKHIIIAESPIEHPTNIKIHYVNVSDPEKSTLITDNVLVAKHRDISSRTSIVKDLFLTGKSSIYLIANISDGIQVFPFMKERNDISGKYDDYTDTKWFLDNVNDSILTMDIVKETDYFVECIVGTKLGHLYALHYNMIDHSFRQFKNMRKYENSIQDSINCIKSNGEELLVGSFDNFIHLIIGNKCESHYIMIENGKYDKEENILVYVDSLKIKKYSVSYVRYYFAYLTNFGCILFMRNIRGQWETIKEFPRDFREELDGNEKSPLIDCIINNDVDKCKFLLISGSEHGKLYVWRYDSKSNEVVSRNVYNVSKTGLVHNLSIVDSSEILFLTDNETSINAIYL
ncbi:hypothetical protein C6P45_001410 [Maudiozyma exigua]|uniref:Uncharacterized protein n=1 Tax=Maudiozyma exigua TaxID=34358 RepID=A0A9P6W1N0_MAUEX|nr:hypothetical protein C6P45_001410 [Kazachstania exigua]